MPISQETPIVWMQSDHSLARKEGLTIEDLKNAPVLVPADVRYDDWRTLMKRQFENAGVTPAFYIQATETLMEFYSIRPEQRVFILPELLETVKALLELQDVVGRPIKDKTCTYCASFTYFTENNNPLLHRI